VIFESYHEEDLVMTKKCLIIAAMFILFTVMNASACSINYKLSDPEGKEQSLRPFTPVDLTIGETYFLTIIFRQDHGRCLIPAEETDLLLYEEKWKTTKDYLPMQLISTTGWEQIGGGSYRIVLEFTPEKEGNWDLQILRECPKGGYDESLIFNIS
jgi:hypothetical protein